MLATRFSHLLVSSLFLCLPISTTPSTSTRLRLLYFPLDLSFHTSPPLLNTTTGATGPGGPEFAAFAKEAGDKHGVECYTSLADLPALPAGTKRLALISGRTADNPKFLTQCIEAGCTSIYLEKPGAPTVAELAAMRDQASTAGVNVLMGYNKNVCKFVREARAYETAHGGHVTFVSNNAYENTPASLGECFERNREGMLKNMAIHELALLVSFYEVTVENIATCVADKEFSSCQTLKGPSGADFTDFDKIKFTITTKTGQSVSVQADRCGGDTSYAKVTDATSGKEVFRHSMPDEEDEAMVAKLQAQYPGAMVRNG
jgi:predicted dehydrogenase